MGRAIQVMSGAGRNLPHSTLSLHRVESGQSRDGREPSDYVWSSYPINALGKVSELCTPHAVYLALGKDANERQASYRELFKHHVDGKLLEDIRLAVNKGMALGSE